TDTDYLLWLGSRSRRGGVYLFKGDMIRADGQDHTVAFDLVALDTGAFGQLAVQCAATDAGRAHLVISRLEMTDEVPQGAEVLPKTRGQGRLATFKFDDPTVWVKEPTWLSNPFETATVNRTAEGLRFEVAEPGKGMKWSCDLREQLPGGYFKMRYRAKGLLPRNDYALYAAVSGGGRSEREQYVFLLNELQADGQWHVATAFYEADLVRTFAVQVQAAEPDAWLEISEMGIWASRPPVHLSEICSFRSGWPARLGPYKPLPLPEGQAAEKAARVLRLADWFEPARVTVSDVPFDLTGGKALVSGGKDLGVLQVPLKGRARQLYLLLGARLPAEEAPGYGTKPARLVVYPHRFVAEAEYGDGAREFEMPVQVATGRACVAAGVGVYALAVQGDRELKSLRLHDGHRGGAFVLAGVTTSQADGPATAATRPRPSVKSHPRQAASRECRVKVDAAGKRLVVQSGALRLDFSLATGLKLIALRSDYLGLGAKARAVEDFEVLTVQAGEQQARASQAKVLALRQVNARTARVELDLGPQVPVRAQMTLTAARPDEVRFDVKLIPQARGAAALKTLRVELPALTGAKASRETSDTWVFFPRRGTVISNKPTAADMPYGGMFPLQVMGVFNPAGGGLYLRTEYTDIVDRRYRVRRVGAGADFGVTYPWWRGEALNCVLGTCAGDWHDELAAYERWRQTWFKPAAPRKQWFRRVFNFRQQFLTFALPAKSGMFDPETRTFHLREVVEQDARAFGGVDYLHLFDWGWSPKHGRCGDYAPWDYLGPPEHFASAIKQLQDSGVPVGLYIEGYLVSPQSSLFKRAQAWQVIKANGQPLEAFAPDIDMCPWVKPWQDYLSAVYGRARQQTGALGYYIDEYGFAHDGHACYSAKHGHPAPVFATAGELQMTRKVRAALGPECAIYTEESPCDVTMQWQDGSFTYAISSVSDDLSLHHLNLTRFAVPDFKTIEIITCDHPLGDNIEALKRILFNGEAIWLEGIADKWFDPRALAFIRKMHRVLASQADCFLSLHPEPLVPAAWEGLYANRFPAEDGRRCVWTIYWTGPRTLQDELLPVRHRPGANYSELLEGRALRVRRQGEEDVIEATVHPHEVLVLLQQLGEG
ncbi:MAG: hypothetical protein J7M26_07225, partial [Armatimonadetes bacterium]|nr:hypothetical protein [Armatimonadota bacterium]